MNRLWFIFLLILSSCYIEDNDQLPVYETNLDSLFLAADSALMIVSNNKEQKTLLEQDLWRKKRDIKVIEKKYTDSIWNLSNMYELNTLKKDSDSSYYNYKIVLREIVDTVRMTVTDTICDVCQTRQNKKDNRFYKKAFRWIKNIEI
jgi:hypothetical protein